MFHVEHRPAGVYSTWGRTLDKALRRNLNPGGMSVSANGAHSPTVQFPVPERPVRFASLAQRQPHRLVDGSRDRRRKPGRYRSDHHGPHLGSLHCGVDPRPVASASGIT